MAVVPGVVQRAYGFCRPHGHEHTMTDTIEYELESCFVDVTFPTGTYAAADDANFNPATVIQNTKRDGKTVTLLGAACAGIGDENGTLVGADVVTSITANVCLVPLLQEDLTTEHGDGAMSAVWNKAIPFFVCYKQPVEG